MNSKYLDKLEYNKILEMLEGFVKTYLGKRTNLSTIFLVKRWCQDE